MEQQGKVSHTWDININYLELLLVLIDEHKNIFKGWKPQNAFEDLSFIFLEKIRVNLLAVYPIMQRVLVMEIHFIPVALLLRTIVTDIIVHKYFRRIHSISGIDGVQQELDVMDLEFVKTMEKIKALLKDEHPTEAADLDRHFETTWSIYLKPNGQRKSAKDIRINQDVNDKIKAYKATNNITADTDKESGKIDFLTDANKRNFKFLYSYLAQFHHYTPRSLYFYKDEDFRKKNIDVARSVIWLSASTMFEVFSDVKPEDPIRLKLKAFAEAMFEERLG